MALVAGVDTHAAASTAISQVASVAKVPVLGSEILFSLCIDKVRFRSTEGLAVLKI